MPSKPKPAAKRRRRAKRRPAGSRAQKRHFHFSKLPQRVTSWAIPVADDGREVFVYPEDD